ncbi:phosphoenolpyruvate synthase [candidate division KSB1 bacterium]|nr:phosphoenolpyruvate synthase [candidate division KSB1 bacterium]RQW06901.1 MAG: phosphoenolpyruvate synthase [candidate division KSB1 bacterium]
MVRFRFFVIILLSLVALIFAQQNLTNDDIAALIQKFKSDERGPYQAIRWFCPDGTILPPNERCSQPGGIQHAVHKEVVTRLARDQGIYLGQILAGTPFEDFWDETNDQSRLKQYIFERYLMSIDDSWLLRRARYYRGAIQDEDENSWGEKFLLWLLDDDSRILENYFTIRQACRVLPHNAGDKLWERIRSTSKVLSDSIPTFINIRIKLHGQPDASDLQNVRAFRLKNAGKISSNQQKLFNQLEADLAEAFRPLNSNSLRQYSRLLPQKSRVVTKMNEWLKSQQITASQETMRQIVDILWECRQELLEFPAPRQRLAAVDLSIALESIIFRDINQWQPATLGDLIAKNHLLTKAVASCGFLEAWEFVEIDFYLRLQSQTKVISLAELQQISEYARRAVEWSSAMVRTVFQESLEKFAGFEPLIFGFIDDRIRVSLLLPFGITAGQVTDHYADHIGLKQQVLNITTQNQVHGLNPGYAIGELVVLPSMEADIKFSPENIYVLASPPSDLKPVAGLMVVSEGNLVSHVQLLARNLGIPNAVITQQNFEELLAFNGKKIFYAVSPQGTVLMKTPEAMTREEEALFTTTATRENKITVPIDKLRLNETSILDLRNVRAKDSGVFTGPKAANLGQLKNLFPEQVVEGLVLPFGIFRQHMDQTMPGSAETCWQFLQQTFETARQQRKNNVPETQIEMDILARLETLRTAIKAIPLLPAFEKELYEKFQGILRHTMGEVPVFIRSDTNMEDLKDFTGAGLNLTVFNVREPQKILQGIRDVWASPFSERSYQWRQRLLLNPENVFPSILIIPSVNVEKSGVMITTGVYSGEAQDITIAFNRGAAGAVEGQMAESYTLKSAARQLLLSPCRERRYTTLPTTGGTDKKIATFEKAILSLQNIGQLRLFAIDIRKRLPNTPGIESQGPFDVELGFKDDKIWLFQVRPFVESKRARSSAYLKELDPKIDKKRMISLEESLQN